MSLKGLLARNAFWNALGTGVNVLTGFVTVPYLVAALGETTYGLWIILGSLAGYFGLLDLGIRGSVGRYVAFYRASEDAEGVNRILSTALALLVIGAILAMAGMLALLPVFDRIYDFPPEQAADVQLALILVAFTLGLGLIGNIFDATLWGFQRFDLLNQVDIPVALARLALTIGLIAYLPSLAALAVINLVVTLAMLVAKAGLSYRESPTLRFTMAGVTRATIHEIFSYGCWSVVYSLSRTARIQVIPLFIGALLGVAMTTPYSVANRLVAVIWTVLVAVTGILTPFATDLHARDSLEQEQKLLLLGGRWCLSLTLLMTVGLVLLGEPLLTLWVGSDLAFAAVLVAVLAVGDVLPNSQHVTGGIIFAKARQKSLALLSIVETVLVIGLMFVLVPRWQLLGACWAVVLPGLVCRGIGPIWLGCVMLRVPLDRYVLQALLPPVACAIAPALVLAALTAWQPPDNWAQLLAYGLCFSALFAAAAYPLLGVKLFRGKPLLDSKSIARA